tara:strand:- start:104 stop:337 length:234 start_codon:yes stop_codon:yes gene_type:complete
VTASAHRLTQAVAVAHPLQEAAKTVEPVFNHLSLALLLITLGVVLQPLMTAILQALEGPAIRTLGAVALVQPVSLAP